MGFSVSVQGSEGTNGFPGMFRGPDDNDGACWVYDTGCALDGMLGAACTLVYGRRYPFLAVYFMFPFPAIWGEIPPDRTSAFIVSLCIPVLYNYRVQYAFSSVWETAFMFNMVGGVELPIGS